MSGHPWNVTCSTHGTVALTKAQYEEQMGDADALWKCPTCGQAAEWDDELYELSMDEHGDEFGGENATNDKFGRRYYNCPGLDDQGDSATQTPGDQEKRFQCDRAEANLLSSADDAGNHWPVIDLDVPARLVDSTTSGHSHLYVDLAVPIDKFLAVLDALVDAGIVQRGFAQHARERGQAFVRPPWVKKGGK